MPPELLGTLAAIQVALSGARKECGLLEAALEALCADVEHLWAREAGRPQ